MCIDTTASDPRNVSEINTEARSSHGKLTGFSAQGKYIWRYESPGIVAFSHRNLPFLLSSFLSLPKRFLSNFLGRSHIDRLHPGTEEATFQPGDREGAWENVKVIFE